MEIIPAIDIIDGKCVRLSQGDFSRMKVYHEDPLEVAKMFEEWGVKRLHLVDLDGAKASHIVNYGILESITSKTSLIVDFGGGIKTHKDLSIAFESGAAMVTGGSIAVKEPEMFISWIQKYGNERIILGADHLKGKVAISGWTQTSERDVIDFIEDYSGKGIKKVICTDISMDGMLRGPSIIIYSEILERIRNIQLIASGGVSNKNDILELKKMGVRSVIIGKAIYEGKITKDDIADLTYNY